MYLGNTIISLINITTPEIKQNQIFIVLEELLKIINKVEDLRSGNIQAEFTTPKSFEEKIINNSQILKITYPKYKNVEFLQPGDVNGFTSGSYSNNPRIKDLLRKSLDMWRNLENLVVIETLKRKKMGNPHQINEIEEIQKLMEGLEKVYLLMENRELANTLEKNIDLLQGYLLDIKQKRIELNQKFGRIMNEKAESYYSESTTNFRFYNPQENELFEMMKHNDQASFILTFLNYNDPYKKVMKFKVPHSNLKVVNSKNQEEPIDIICQEEGSCTLYMLVEMDGWSEISVKLVPSQQKQELYPLTKAGKIGFWTSAGSLELAMDQQMIRYKRCKDKDIDNIELTNLQDAEDVETPGMKVSKKVLTNTQKENKDVLQSLMGGVESQVQNELEKQTLDQNIREQLRESIAAKVIGRIKESGDKIKEQAEKSVQALEGKTQQLGDLADKIKERVQRFVLLSVKNEVQREIEQRSGHDSHKPLKETIGKAVMELVEKNSLSDTVTTDDRQSVLVEVFKDVLNKIDIQQWIMTEKIVDKMEAKTGEKIGEKQREQITQEVRKELLSQAIEKGLKDIHEKVESKMSDIMKKIQQDKLLLQEQEVQQQITEQMPIQEESLSQVKNKLPGKEKVQEKKVELKSAKEEMLKVKNELVLLKEEKQKLMVKGEEVSDELVQNILEKESKIQALADKIRQIEINIEGNKHQKKELKLLKIEKAGKQIEQAESQELENEQQLEQQEQAISNIGENIQKVEKEQEIEKEEQQINKLKKELSQKEKQYEHEVKTVEELREEINNEKNRLVEEERKLQEIQMNKLSIRMEEEKTGKTSLLQKINELGQLKATVQEIQQKEQQVQAIVNEFAKMLEENHEKQNIIQGEEETSKHAFNVINELMGNMEQEQQTMTLNQEAINIVENELESERERLGSMVRQKELNLVEIQTQKEKIQTQLNGLPNINFHSFLESQRIVNDQYVCLEENFFVNFLEYTCDGTDKCSDQTYFRPQGHPTDMFSIDPEIIFYQGQIMAQIKVNYPGVKSVFTIYKDFMDLGFVEVETFAENIPFLQDKIQTKEIALAITSTEIVNDFKFTTDSNGYFLTEKKIIESSDMRKQIAQNYFPASMISVTDEKTSISMNANLQGALGVTSQKQGQIEIMYSRLLNRTSIPANFTFALSFDDNSQYLLNILTNIQSPFLIFFVRSKNKFKVRLCDYFQRLIIPLLKIIKGKFIKNANKVRPPSKTLNLPKYIKTQFRLLEKNEILLHISNMHTTDPYQIQLFESSTNSINNIFCKLTGMMIKFEEIKETTLAGNQEISDLQQLKWHQSEENIGSDTNQQGIVQLMPMQTRTFLFKF